MHESISTLSPFLYFPLPFSDLSSELPLAAVIGGICAAGGALVLGVLWYFKTQRKTAIRLQQLEIPAQQTQFGNGAGMPVGSGAQVMGSAAGRQAWGVQQPSGGVPPPPPAQTHPLQPSTSPMLSISGFPLPLPVCVCVCVYVYVFTRARSLFPALFVELCPLLCSHLCRAPSGLTRARRSGARELRSWGKHDF